MGFEHRCHSMTTDDYEYCIRVAREEGQLVMLDMDPQVKPDIVATVYKEPWADLVNQKFGSGFDIIIDEITCIPLKGSYYESEAEKLLKADGIFYGWQKKQKVKWFNTSQGLCLVD